MDLKKVIRGVPDFPKPGILFFDITTLMADPAAFRYVLDDWQKRYQGKVDAVVGVEARGFVFGGALADRLGVKFVPARKPKKLPYKTIRQEYELEYGTDALEMHIDALEKGERVVIVDDLLATGGTCQAVARMCEHHGAEIVEICFVIELTFLKARAGKLQGYKIHSLVEYDSE